MDHDRQLGLGLDDYFGPDEELPEDYDFDGFHEPEEDYSDLTQQEQKMKQISKAKYLKRPGPYSQLKDCHCDKVCECHREYLEKVAQLKWGNFCPWCGGKIKEIQVHYTCEPEQK